MTMPAGPELDALICDKVFGRRMVQHERVCINGTWYDGPYWMAEVDNPSDPPCGYSTAHALPKYSSQIAIAWEIIEKLAPLAGDFSKADGFFILKYADSADHGEHDDNPCDTPQSDDDEDCDSLRWSCHFHLGLLGADTCPKHWDHGNKYCARGTTAAHAICNAAVKAMTEVMP